MLRPFLARTAPLVVFSGVLVACGGSQSTTEAPSPDPAAAPAEEPLPEPGDGDGTAARPEITTEACEHNGGVVVGDIGDGAIHRADYRCPSGAEPIGTISAPEGGPIGVEGSVCCPQ